MFRHHHIEATSTSFTSRTTRPVILPVRIAEEERFANALPQYVAFMRSKGIEIKELRAGEKVLNEGEMKKNALANNIHTEHYAAVRQEGGRRTSESLILSGRMSWPYYSQHRTCRANTAHRPQDRRDHLQQHDARCYR
ncbi:hypothetical protein RI054_32g126230 [Pseudoscourfieldia marina]